MEDDGVLGTDVLEPELLDAGRSPDQVAAWAVAVAPADGLFTPFGELDPATLSHRGRVDLLVALARQQAWLDAQQQLLLAAMAADPAQPDTAQAIAKQWVREDVACALRLPAVTAGARLALAADLVDRLPSTLEALRRGEITLLHARALADGVAPLDDAAALIVEGLVLGRAGTQTVAEFRRHVTRAVLKVDARPAQERHDDATAERRVVCTPVQDGMSELWALLPAEAAAGLMTALDALAHDPALPDPTACGPVDPGADCRTIDQRRADALTVLAFQALPGGQGGMGVASWQGQRPAIQVTVALSTLLGLDEQPGELDRHGPIPATLARRLADDPTGTWRRLLTDEHGQLLDYGRTTYRPPANLRDYVIARDRTCRMPGCYRTARRCELDHVAAWGTGGATTEPGLHALCSRHHHVRHEAGWAPSRSDDGSTVWRSPSGHHYVKPLAPLPVDHTADPPAPF